MTSCLLSSSVDRPQCSTSRFHLILLPALDTSFNLFVLEVQHKVNYSFFHLLCAVGTSGVCLPHHLYSGDLPEDSGLRPGDASQLLHPKRLEPAGFCHRHCWVRIWFPLLLSVQTFSAGPNFCWDQLVFLLLPVPIFPPGSWFSFSSPLIMVPKFFS